MNGTQHTTHRLEAFSDIVIGFCLAQLGLNLVLPKSATDLFGLWESTTFFISAFIFIAVLWWLHHRTFSWFFVLNAPMILMNFAMLCALILTLYFFESTVRIAELGQSPARLLSMCIFSLAIVYTLAGLMLLIGMALRRAELPVDEMRWGIGQLTSIAIAVIFGLAAGTYLALGTHAALAFYAAVGSAIAVLAMRRFLKPLIGV